LWINKWTQRYVRFGEKGERVKRRRVNSNFKGNLY
jgi:hypothetical protein